MENKHGREILEYILKEFWIKLVVSLISTERLEVEIVM